MAQLSMETCQNKSVGISLNKQFTVVHVISSLTTGGAEVSLLRLCREQVKHYPKVVVISLQPQAELHSQFVGIGVTVVYLNMTKASQVLRIIATVRRVIVQTQTAVVHSWMYYSNAIVSAACIGLGIKIIWSIRRTEVPSRSVFSRCFMRFCAFLSHISPARVCYNAEAGLIAHEAFGYTRHKSVFIPNGFDFSTARELSCDSLALRQQLGISADKVIIVSAGRWHIDKGQDLLLEALNQIRKQFPMVVLVLVGRGCEISNKDAVSLLAHHNVRDNVYLVGEQVPVDPWMRLADIYCMPSRTEGFPNALIEAIAMDMPFIATNVGDTAAIVGETSNLVKPEISELVAAVLRILSEPADTRNFRAQQLGARIRKRFGIAEIAKRYDKLYGELLKAV